MSWSSTCSGSAHSLESPFGDSRASGSESHGVHHFRRTRLAILALPAQSRTGFSVSRLEDRRSSAFRLRVIQTLQSRPLFRAGQVPCYTEPPDGQTPTIGCGCFWAHHNPLSFPALPSFPGSWGRSRAPPHRLWLIPGHTTTCSKSPESPESPVRGGGLVSPRWPGLPQCLRAFPFHP